MVSCSVCPCLNGRLPSFSFLLKFPGFSHYLCVCGSITSRPARLRTDGERNIRLSSCSCNLVGGSVIMLQETNWFGQRGTVALSWRGGCQEVISRHADPKQPHFPSRTCSQLQTVGSPPEDYWSLMEKKRFLFVSQSSGITFWNCFI